MQNYFIFKNINSIDYGIIVNKLPPTPHFELRREEYTVDGRDGYVSSSDGSYESETIPIECTLINISNTRNILSWLRGHGKLICSNESDKFFKAEIVNKIPFEQIFNNGIKSFIISFKLQPFAYLLEGQNTIVLTSHSTIFNLGTYYSKPIIKIYGTGLATVTINTQSFEITDIGNDILINSELEQCNKGRMMKGEFPILEEGTNNISWTGNITKIEITPNWRCL